ncbi:DUF3995 domain-containing protein [Modestobacter sp. NPDC049651]|uniref:DUF3995 domain-containing protein n=1 Tax=unclassified Modestobacter TaxID=2643866 RepID=UPI0033D7697C
MTPAGRAAAAAGVALALGSAALSLYWTAGGTALLDTVGGEVERLARERTPAAVALGAGTVLAKLVAAALALALLRRPRRPVRLLAWAAGALLTLWGGANVLLGGLVLLGVLDLGVVADERALRWHVLVWDLWFLLWGAALLVACWSARRGQRRGAVDRRSTSAGGTSSARDPG